MNKYSLQVTALALAGLVATSYPLMSQARDNDYQSQRARSTSGATDTATPPFKYTDPNYDADVWNQQNQYWSANYATRPYYQNSMDYADYEPAYRYGMEMFNRNPGRSFEDLNQADLRNGWNNQSASANLSWEDAQGAVRDAYTRMYESDRGNNSATSRSNNTKTPASNATTRPSAYPTSNYR